MLEQDRGTPSFCNLFSMLIRAKAAVNLPYVLRDRLIPNREDVYSVELVRVASRSSSCSGSGDLTIMAWAGLRAVRPLWVLPTT